jgi:hypothetical protein
VNDTDGDEREREREREEQQNERTNVVQIETGPTDKRSSWFESAAQRYLGAKNCTLSVCVSPGHDCVGGLRSLSPLRFSALNT